MVKVRADMRANNFSTRTLGTGKKEKVNIHFQKNLYTNVHCIIHKGNNDSKFVLTDQNMTVYNEILFSNT